MVKSARRKKTTREERTAYHEAGHAVLHDDLRYARKLRKATIIPEPDEHNLGHVLLARFPPSFQPDIDVTPYQVRMISDEIVCAFGGGIAEARFAGRHDNRGARGDRNTAVDLVLYFVGSVKQGEAYVRYLWVQAEEVVEFHWPEIEAVAKALLERKTLTRKEVRDIRLRVMRENIGGAGLPVSDPAEQTR